MKYSALIPVMLAPMLVSPAMADIDVRFIEGAPVDRFTFTAGAGCPVGAATLSVDLEGSAGQLIFDTTGAGAGVQVFQPFVLTEGAAQVETLPDVRDGDRVVTLKLARLDMPLAFTTDVDDTIGARETTVTGSEIAGAVVRVTTEGAVYSAVFDENATARVALPACAS